MLLIKSDAANSSLIRGVGVQVLSRYLAHKGSSFIHEKNILELGAGTGLVGLTAAQLGARVSITDQLLVSTIF